VPPASVTRPPAYCVSARLYPETERGFGERLELGLEDGPLLVAQRELIEPLGDRQPVEPGQPLDCQQRIVRVREHLLDAVHEPIPAASRDRIALVDRARSSLLADVPACLEGRRGQLHREPGAGDLRPRVGLVPVDPAAAVFDRHAFPRSGPGATPEPVARFEQQHRAPAERRLACGGHAGEAAPDHDHVVRVLAGAHRRPPSARVSSAAPSSSGASSRVGSSSRVAGP
jgi:hypothetical protein